MSHIECVSSNITVVQRVTPALRVKHYLKQMQSRSRPDDGRKCTHAQARTMSL